MVQENDGRANGTSQGHESLAVIFPGQGSQFVGMGRDIARQSEGARRIYEQANQILGFDLAGTCYDGPAAKLEQTDIQQPAIFATSAAIWEAYLEAGARREWFCSAGGLSLGEYSALYAAGALTFEEGLLLVYRRGKLMQRAAEASPSGMICLVGTDEETAREICERARGGGVLVLANHNCPGQIVIAGDESACVRAMQEAQKDSCRAVRLGVAGAFHSPLMKPAADELMETLEQTRFAQPRVSVVSNVDAEYHGGAGSIRDRLHRQVTQPVLWQRCVERMIGDGVTRFVEIGPGRILSGLMKKINRRVAVSAIGTAKEIEAALEKTGVR